MNQKGQGLVEYALILVFIATVVIIFVALLGPSIQRIVSGDQGSIDFELPTLNKGTYVPVTEYFPISSRTYSGVYQYKMYYLVHVDTDGDGKFTPMLVAPPTEILYDVAEGKCFINVESRVWHLSKNCVATGAWN